MFGLERIQGERIDVLKPYGWAGDQLIWAGARNIFRQHGVEFRQFPSDREALNCDDRSDWLYIYGSGGYCEENHSLLDRLPPIIERWRNVVILPSSFDIGYEPVAQFLSNLPKNVTIYCRELYSYRMVRDFSNQVFIEHDTAFNFNFLAWIQPRGSGDGVLEEFYKHSNIIKYTQNTRDLIIYINKWKEVKTDRAHVAITAAKLLKPTKVFPGGYHKLRGIYEFSLSHLGHVEFVET